MSGEARPAKRLTEIEQLDRKLAEAPDADEVDEVVAGA
jgi:hypothetical protein